MRMDAIVTEILPPDMKVLMNHIYEYKKGVRQMVLFTFNKRYEDYATARLKRQNISYTSAGGQRPHKPVFRPQAVS